MFKKTVLNNIDIFNEEISNTLLKKASEDSNFVYGVLEKYFTENKVELTKELYEIESYDNIAWALSEVAIQPQYFDFASRQLLAFAAKEVELGVYHGNYKAIHALVHLFPNACAQNKVSLKLRMQYLELLINEADEQSSYSKLFVLMKVLGKAANVFESGAYDYVEDEDFEGYIHFAVDTLLHYAGRNDENGLDLTAEEELHDILKHTIDEPDILGASDIPFRILKAYLVSGRDWNESPIYHIDKIYKFIQDCKKDKDYCLDVEEIKKFELRFEQLISLGAEREFIAEDFILYLGAKKSEKICEIGLDKDEQSSLELHERQSLAERLVFSGTTSLHDIQRGMPKTTYLIVNFGMIISEQPYNKGDDIKRIFKTVPVEVPETVISGREYGYGGHAEEALYEYLLKEKNISFLLSKFKVKTGIKASNHKIYTIVLDLHGTYDMCLSCSNKGFDFQNNFRNVLLSILLKENFKTIEKYPNQLPIIIRYSSDLQYHYENTSEENKKGLLTIIKRKGEKRDLQKNIISNNLSYTMKRDIKYYGSNLLIHGKENWHSFWSISNNRQNFINKKLPLENWTAFTTDYQYQRQLTEEQKKTDYTIKGLVDTRVKSMPTQKTEDENNPFMKPG